MRMSSNGGEAFVDESREPRDDTDLRGSSDEVRDSDDVMTNNSNLTNIVLAVLFAAEEPVSVRRLVAIIEDTTADAVRDAIEGLRQRFDEERWSICVEQIAGGYQVTSRPDYAAWISRLYSGRRKFRLSRAAMETLAVIAYRQPTTRAEIENIRGVSCGGVITNLMERSLVRITGKARVLGAPFLYGTTPEFLEYLGLNALGDLPNLEELERLIEQEAYPETTTESEAAGEEKGDAQDGPTSAHVVDDAEPFDFEGAVEQLDRMARAAAEATTPGQGNTDADQGGQESSMVADPPLSGGHGEDHPGGDPLPTIQFPSTDSDPAVSAPKESDSSK